MITFLFKKTQNLNSSITSSPNAFTTISNVERIAFTPPKSDNKKGSFQ